MGRLLFPKSTRDGADSTRPRKNWFCLFQLIGPSASVPNGCIPKMSGRFKLEEFDAATMAGPSAARTTKIASPEIHEQL
jgi:hypothetical protein